MVSGTTHTERYNMLDYGWIITKDHLCDEFGGDSEVGTMGPFGILPEVEEALKSGKGHTFRMYDDDGELYYTGRTYAINDNMSDDACYAPLGDFGMPGAGAVEIRYHGHSEWNCS